MVGRDDWPEMVVEAVCRRSGCSPQRRRTLAAVVRLAAELAHEGREGRRVGTLMIVGDVHTVLRRSRPLILDPLAGHDPQARHVGERSLRETVKELAQLDGAFVVDDAGTFVSAARFVEVTVAATERLPTGLGARHAAAASISEQADAVAVAVSESSLVRVFAHGELQAEVAPHLFLAGENSSFAIDNPAVHELPEVGLTVALVTGASH
jgi:diadenylate cyclase